MNALKMAQEAASELQRELKKRRERKLRELFSDEAVNHANNAARQLNWVGEEDGEKVLAKNAGENLVKIFSKLNSVKQPEESREMLTSLVAIEGAVARLNNVAQTGLFGTHPVAYETSKVKSFLAEAIRGFKMYREAGYP